MRAQLQAIIQELKTLKREGVSSIYLEAETLAALHSLSVSESPSPEAPSVVPVALPSEPQPEDQSNLVALWNRERTPPVKPEAPQQRVPKQSEPLPDGVKPIPAPESFDLPKGDKRVQWSWLREKVLTDPVCREHVRLDAGKQVVFGVGDLDAEIFYCAEAPGADEETQGEPFVGKAGQLLNKIIEAMGLSRDQVMISNIMNWRPEHDRPYGNRPPTQAEITYCLPYLQAQINIVKPKVLVALGATATHGLLGYDPNRTVGRTRGKWIDFKGIPLILTHHPSYLLRNNTNRSKRLVWEDMLLVMEKVGLPVSQKQRRYFAENQ